MMKREPKSHGAPTLRVVLACGLFAVAVAAPAARASTGGARGDRAAIRQATISATPSVTPSVTPEGTEPSLTPSVTSALTPSSTPLPTWTASPGAPPAPDGRVLTAPDGLPKDYFGYEVAIDGRRAAIGTWDYSATNTKMGAVYLFERNGATWTFEAKLTIAADDEGYSGLGHALALQGDVLVAGAPLASVNGVAKGSAAVFRREAGVWTEEATLTGDGGLYEVFGYSVAVDGDTIVVGAPKEDASDGEEAGAAYVFERRAGTWQRTARLGEALARPADGFGWDVAIGGQHMLVASPGDDTGGNAHGAVHVYRHIGGVWVRQQVLLPHGSSNEAPQFGTSVTLDASSGVAAVGAPFADLRQGHVYIYQWSADQWIGTADFGPFEGNDSFLGWSVAIRDGILVAGAPGDDRFGESAGAAYAYRAAGGWHLRERWLLDDAEPFDTAGWSVATDGAYVVMGVPGDDRGGWDTGSARAFSSEEGVPTVWPPPTMRTSTPPTPTPEGRVTEPTPTHTPTLGTPPTPTATSQVFEGVYGRSFEVSSFIARSDCQDGAASWLVPNAEFDAAFAGHFPHQYQLHHGFPYTGAPLRARVRFRGELQGPGQFGHVGAYPYEVQVRELLLMEPVDCGRYVDLGADAERLPKECEPPPGQRALRVCVWNYGNQPVGPFTVATDSGQYWRVEGLGAVEYRCLPAGAGDAAMLTIDVDNEVAEDVESNNVVLLSTPDPSATALPTCPPTPVVTPTATVHGTLTPTTSPTTVPLPPGTSAVSATATSTLPPGGFAVYLPAARQGR